MGADEYVRETKTLFSEAEAMEQRAQELKGAWLRDQFEMLRKAINLTPRDFETRLRKDPKGTFEFLKARYERLAQRG
jgi:hypothetical protein